MTQEAVKINGAEVSTFDRNAMRLYTYVQKELAKANSTDTIGLLRRISIENNKRYKDVRLLYIRGHRLIMGYDEAAL